jgi:hypothetical protein
MLIIDLIMVEQSETRISIMFIEFWSFNRYDFLMVGRSFSNVCHILWASGLQHSLIIVFHKRKRKL